MTFLFLLPLSNLFHCFCHVLLYSKTPKQVFFNPINIFDTFFTTLYYTVFFVNLFFSFQGDIEEDEFVGFIEGSLDPAHQNFLAEGAEDLKKKIKPRSRSPLMIDQIIGQDRLHTNEVHRTNPAIIEFVNTLQELERLYIHRRTYQIKINHAKSTAGVETSRGCVQK